VWDDGASVQSDSQVVPCDSEHFIEITGTVELTGMPEEYPSPAGWTSIIGERCQQLAETAYGAKLDPEGRFTAGGLKPVEAGWQQGQRQLWCGIQANWVDQPVESGASLVDQPTRFTGAAKGQPQYWVYKAGDCLGGISKNPVACTQPHEIEVVGEITLNDRPTVPSVDDTKAWTGLAGSACDKQVRTYLGGKAPKAPWEGSFVAITPESWAAGKRNVTCIVGSSMTGGWATVSVSAKTAAR
jgi:hypothetical protein